VLTYRSAEKKPIRVAHNKAPSHTPGMRNPTSLGLTALVCLSVACAPDAPSPPPPTLQEVPGEAPGEWIPLIGEYSGGGDTLSVLEDGGVLFLLPWHGERQALGPATDSTFPVGEAGETLVVRWRDGSRVGELALGELVLRPLFLGGESGGTFRITPLRPPEEIREEALAAIPPEEEGDFLPSDLVELVAVDPKFRLDIRYAGTNNFMNEVFYSSPRAFLQRPAAEAVARARAWLEERGFGLMVFDGYRPWYVTKMFWDATPEPLRNFVADPASGSRHNRGCAIDLTLFDLESGEVVTMPGGFDEMSPRSFVAFPGGTERQRWLRDLLREAMEAQDFTVYEDEWWHFDYKDWRRYRIGNETFEELGG